MTWTTEPEALDALFVGVPAETREPLEKYFLTDGDSGGGQRALRSRAFALYDPFADRRVFPASVRYCLNVYAGCSHGCTYCYTRNYIREVDRPRSKAGLERQARRDLAAMHELELPPVPLHISNSTDPFQEPLETKTRTCLGLLDMVIKTRRRFSMITFLTKNPSLAATPGYLARLRDLMPCQVEVSLSFADDEGRRVYEPGAPSVSSRLEGIRALREAGIPVSLRVDPLFPRDPLPCPPWGSARVSDYGVGRTHSLEEIQRLVEFAANVGCQKVIVSALKLPFGRSSPTPFREQFRGLFAAAFGGKPRARGAAYRLPDGYIEDHLLGPVRDLCRAAGIPMVHCKHNLVSTR